MEALILIPPNWQLEFHVHTNASLSIIGAILAQNPTGKYDQPIEYAFKLLNKAKKNYITIKREALAMVYALHKFRHTLLGNKFVFYIDHMVMVYLVNEPHVLGKIARWLLLFLEYEFTIVYKHSRTHVVANALFRLLHSLEPLGVPNKTMDASLFFVEPLWM
jgi:hypothetical protein